jgi:hypothetical protein
VVFDGATDIIAFKRMVNALLDEVSRHQVVRSATLEEYGALKSEVPRLRKRSGKNRRKPRPGDLSERGRSRWVS